MNSMFASTTTNFSIPVASELSVAHLPRRISADAGRALEKLSHAIEYLTLLFDDEEGPAYIQDGRYEAVELLMRENLEVYFACPEVPTLRQRLTAWLHR